MADEYGTQGSGDRLLGQFADLTLQTPSKRQLLHLLHPQMPQAKCLLVSSHLAGCFVGCTDITPLLQATTRRGTESDLPGVIPAAEETGTGETVISAVTGKGTAGDTAVVGEMIGTTDTVVIRDGMEGMMVGWAIPTETTDQAG